MGSCLEYTQPLYLQFNWLLLVRQFPDQANILQLLGNDAPEKRGQATFFWERSDERPPHLTVREPRREECMKDLLAKEVAVKSIQAVTNWKQGKDWCVWETDTIERLEGIMAEFPLHRYHTSKTPTTGNGEASS